MVEVLPGNCYVICTALILYDRNMEAKDGSYRSKFQVGVT